MQRSQRRNRVKLLRRTCSGIGWPGLLQTDVEVVVVETGFEGIPFQKKYTHMYDVEYILHVYIDVHIYIYIYIFTHTHTFVHIETADLGVPTFSAFKHLNHFGQWDPRRSSLPAAGHKYKDPTGYDSGIPLMLGFGIRGSSCRGAGVEIVDICALLN